MPKLLHHTPTIQVPTLPMKLFLLDDAALKLGVHIVAGPGTGKSRLMGRVLAWQAFVRGKPVVVLDPTGGIVANIIDKISLTPEHERRTLWSRLVYVDAGSTDYVVPTPLYYRNREMDTFFEIANRFPSVLKRQDPELQSAPILGWNSLHECAIHSGRIAAALNRQLDFVVDLIRRPQLYKDDLRQVLMIYPELEDAVTYFRQLMDTSNVGLRERRTGSFASKLLPFVSDPTMLATFAAPDRSIDWEKVVEQGQMVIIDFQQELDPDRRQFKLLWWYRDFSAYVNARGMDGRGCEILFFIDEVTQLVGQRTGKGNAVLLEDLIETVSVHGRNFGVNVIIAHQNLSQIDERIRDVLMQCGTQVVGRISNPDDALFLARHFLKYDPHKVKKQEPIWMGVMAPNLGYALPKIVDYRDVPFTPEEQLLMGMERFHLPRFQFLVQPALAEGTVSKSLFRISIERLDAGQYPDNRRVQRILGFLRKKCGVPLEQLLAEIRGRWAFPEKGSREKSVKPTTALVILDGKSLHAHEAKQGGANSAGVHDTVFPAAEDSPEAGETNHDSFWR